LAKIAEICDHNVDPRFNLLAKSFFFESGRKKEEPRQDADPFPWKLIFKNAIFSNSEGPKSAKKHDPKKNLLASELVLIQGHSGKQPRRKWQPLDSEQDQGCQIFLGTTIQNWKKYTKITIKIHHKIDQMAPKCTNFHCKTLKNSTKVGFLV
jgi:hypothetical protein